MSRRDRVNEAIRKEVSVIVHDKLKDPRLGFVTITGVELTADLRRALIFFSVLGNEEDYKKTKKALDNALGFIRSLVAQRINLRLAPEIVFKEDRSAEYSVRIQEVLQEIKELDQPDHSPKKEVRQREKRKERKGEPKKSCRLHKKV
ncbi:MAG: 30S ribosome-binding factor RbfA [Candidatus Omnitrophica bacterium]|nr:30S ribosome-binding factor RbfA [Candidatus Omnitrophota bacterium]